jgi:hypothetical protein
MTPLLRSRWAAIGAAVAVTLGAGGGFGIARATITSGERAAFVPITPCRLFKTNPPTVGPRTTPLGPDDTVTFQVTGTNGNCTIPAGASAVVITLVGLNQTANTFLTAFPADVAQPLAATMNLAASATGATSSLATIKLSATGAIKLFNKNGTVNVVADITGYYEDHNHDDRYQSAKQQRLVAFTNGPTPLLSDVETQPAIALGADRLPIVAFFNDTVDDLYIVRCLAACGGIATTPVEQSGSVGYAPSIAIGSDGLAVIAHSRQIGTGLFVRHCSNVACDASTGVTIDAGAATATPSSIAIGTDGFPIIAYPVGSDVRTVHCGDVLCTPGLIATTTHTTPVVDGFYISVAIGSDGLPVIAHQTGDADLAVMRCTNVACSASTQVIGDNQSVPLGYDAAVAIGVDGFPVVAHRILTGGTLVSADLRITRCTNLACSSVVSTTVDSGPNQVGEFASIAVGADGVPIVAYRDETANTLKVARCADIGCTAVEPIPTDAGAGSGFGTSMVIDALGLPVIAHMDNTTNQDIRVTILTNQGWGPS